MLRLLTLALAALALAGCTPDRLAPFSDIRWTDAPTPEVEVGGEWFALVRAGGVPADRLVHTAVEREGRHWQDALAYRFRDVVRAAGGEAGRDVTLRLRSAEGVTDRAVPFRRENYDRVLWAYGLNDRRVGPPHPEAPALPELTRRVDGRTPPPDAFAPPLLASAAPAEWVDAWSARFYDRPAWLRPEEAAADLGELEYALAEEFAYRTLRGVDAQPAFDAVRADLGDGISRRDFLLQIDRLLARFGDGHTGIDGDGSGDLLADFLAWGVLPFHPVAVDGRVAAVEAGYGGFVDDARPFVAAIEGVPLARWLREARTFEKAGSPALRQESRLKRLRLVGLLARALGVPLEADRVRVTLVAKDGGSARTVRLPLRYEPFWTADRPGGPALAAGRVGTVLPGDVGYLALRQPMSSDEDDVRALVRQLEALHETRALVIDVRGNGGGQRDPLLALLPYFLSPEGGPVVASAGALRIDETIDPHPPEGFLGDRGMYPAASARWTPAERRAIDRFAARFDREAHAPDSAFSDLHYLVVRPDAPFHYDRPVAVLTDGANFSAADVFAGAFAALPQVVLVGGATSGGSGYARPQFLTYSSVQVGVSSMASFRPDGRLYEFGIEPDVPVPLGLADWRRLLAGDDPVLEAARARLRAPRASRPYR